MAPRAAAARSTPADPVQQIVRLASLLSFPLLLTIGVLFQLAKPPFTTFADRAWSEANGTPARTTWDPEILQYLAPAVGVAMVVSVAGLVLASRSGEGKLPVPLILLAVASVVGALGVMS